MIRRFIGIAVVAASVALPFAAQAQGVPGGVERGSREGERAAGSGRRDRRGCDRWCRRRRERRPGRRRASAFSHLRRRTAAPLLSVREDLRIGAVLPEEGVTYYDVPTEYGVRDYRYTVVNGRTVLVEPRSRRIVEIVE
jgi:hypothetical protein